MAGFSLGLFWNILNFICGIALIVYNFGIITVVNMLNLVIAVAICWISITHKVCDKAILVWFPYWENFLFKGIMYLYLSANLWYATDFVFGFFGAVVFITGILWCLFWLLKRFAGVAIPDPEPMETLCGGTGATTNDQNGQTGATA